MSTVKATLRQVALVAAGAAPFAGWILIAQNPQGVQRTVELKDESPPQRVEIADGPLKAALTASLDRASVSYVRCKKSNRRVSGVLGEYLFCRGVDDRLKGFRLPANRFGSWPDGRVAYLDYDEQERLWRWFDDSSVVE